MAVLAAVVLAGCGGSGTPEASGSAGASDAAPLTPVSLQLQWVAQAQFAGYYAAVDQGFYEDHGLDVDIVEGGVDIVPQTQLADGAVDLLFLDAERTAYLAWWPDVQRVLRPGGLLVVDNALAPDPAELSDLLDAIAATDHWSGDIVPVGKGLFLAWKATAGPNGGR